MVWPEEVACAAMRNPRHAVLGAQQTRMEARSKHTRRTEDTRVAASVLVRQLPLRVIVVSAPSPTQAGTRCAGVAYLQS